MGFCEALMVPSGVVANKNTIARIKDRTHFIYN